MASAEAAGGVGEPPLRVAVVGCGLIGRRRAEVARRVGDAVVAVVDVEPDRAQALAREIDCPPLTDWREAAARDDVDAIVVSTSNNWLAPVAVEAIRRGKHVLVEKPIARNAGEAATILQVQAEVEDRAGRRPVVGAGFNHRHHAAVRRAHELARAGAIGDLLYVRCRYGHGGRPGYDREWRANRALSGGGELLDQGVHAIDLGRWFLGEFAEAFGYTRTYVWTGTGGATGAEATAVEDNAFALFHRANGQVAQIHASWTQWRNLFCFEVFGRAGYLIVEGLGGSYGTERLRVGRRRVEGGAPAEETVEFPEADTSWEREWREFRAAIREGRQPLATAHDGWQALRLVEAVYAAERTRTAVRL